MMLALIRFGQEEWSLCKVKKTANNCAFFRCRSGLSLLRFVCIQMEVYIALRKDLKTTSSFPMGTHNIRFALK